MAQDRNPSEEQDEKTPQDVEGHSFQHGGTGGTHPRTEEEQDQDVEGHSFQHGGTGGTHPRA